MKKLLASIMLLLTMMMGIGTISVSAANISGDAKQLNGHSYKLYNTGYTWSQAKKYCEEQGGYLVTITSEAEQKLVTELVKKGTKNSYWMGGYCKGESWRWITGERFSYSNWASNMPDNYLNQENRLMIYRNQNPLATSGYLGKWNDLNGNGTCNGETFFGKKNLGFICEWDYTQDVIKNSSVKLSKNSYVYNGKERKPNVVVKISGQILVKDKDYELTYVANKYPGAGYVLITGIGDYTGSVKKYFTIAPQKVTNVSVTSANRNVKVKWRKQSNVTGYQIQYTTPFGTVKTKNLTSNTSSVMLKNLSKGNVYTIRVRAYAINNGKTAYGDWSNLKNITVK